MVRKSLAFYIIGLILLVTVMMSLTYYYVEVWNQGSILAIHERSKDKDTRFVIKSLIEKETGRLSALSKSLKEREDLIVDIAISSAEDRHPGSLKTAIDRLVRDLDIGILQVTDQGGTIIYDPHNPSARGRKAEFFDASALGRGEELLEVSESESGWAIRATAPAFMGRTLVGSIMIGTRMNDALASGFSKATNVQTTFCAGDRIIASSLPPARRGLVDFQAVGQSLGEGVPVRRYDPDTNIVSYYEPIRVLRRELVLVNEFDTREFVLLNAKRKERHVRILAAFTAAALLLGSVLAIQLISPLKRLKLKAETTVKEITGSDAPVSGGNEVKSLVRSFNVMVDTVKSHLEERKKMEESLRQAKQDWENTFNSITDMVTIHDKDFTIVAANKSAMETLNLPELHTGKVKCFNSYHGELKPPKRCPSCECAAFGKSSTDEVFEPHLGRHIEVRAIPRMDSNMNLTGIIHIVRDITERKKMEDELIRQALYDSLTGLPNRVLFMDRLKNLFARRERHPNLLFAVLFIDLDHFKKINDSLGHIFGDELLVAVSAKLKEHLRPGDTISRFGGDEFLVLLDELTGADHATDVAQRIMESLKLPFVLRGVEVFTSASVGIAVIDHAYREPEEFLRDADTAMYHAKGMGRACYSAFSPTMHLNAVESMRLENDLRRAIERKEFILHYQPILNLESGGVSGFEALIRWVHPVHGMIMPDKFIPTTEETGLIVHIGEWVLREACGQIKKWQATYEQDPPLTMSVNLSVKQFTDELPGIIGRVVSEAGIKPNTLKVEITESVLMKNAELALDILSQLKDMGVQVYLDDFGTGYSSLKYIHKFPVDALKIDRSFVKEICSDREAQEIVRAIASLARNLDMMMIVEGVENNSQLEIFRSLDCKYTQGFLFSAPMESAFAEKYLHDALSGNA